MNKNRLMYVLMIVMFFLPLIVLFPAFSSFFVFWEEEFNKPLFEALYNATFVLAFIVACIELITAIAGIVLCVVAYVKEEVKRFPTIRVICFLLFQNLFSVGTFILSFLTVHTFTYGMGV